MIQVGEYALPEIADFGPAVDQFNAGRECWCRGSVLPDGRCDRYYPADPHRRPCDDCLLCSNFPQVMGTDANMRWAHAIRFRKQQEFAKYAETRGYKIIKRVRGPWSAQNRLRNSTKVLGE